MEMPYIFIIRPSAEIGLKTFRKRVVFLRKLEQNIVLSMNRAGICHKLRNGFRFYFLETENRDRTLSVLKHIFGISSISPVMLTTNSVLEEIENQGESTFADIVKGKTFCVRSRRFGAQKVSSRDVEMGLGARLAKFGKVKLNAPEITVQVEIHNKNAYLFHEKIAGAKGFPSGIQNRALALISGGFDSPVAAWRVMRRGVNVDYVFFNIGGRAYERQVLQIVKILVECWAVGQNPKLYILDFQNVLADLKAKILTSYRQVVLKRLMIKAAAQIAREIDAHALITGEAIAQVSSQTLPNLNVIDQATEMQVLRPLVASEKEEIIAEAHKIGTAFLSEKVQEYCSISQGSPVIFAKPQKLKFEEYKLDYNLVEESVRLKKTLDVFSLTAEDLRRDFLLVDAISPEDTLVDCQQSHLRRVWSAPNSLHINPEDFREEIKSLDKKKKYVLYCTYGTQTPAFAETMQQLGYNAYAFANGVKQLQNLL